MAPVNILKFFSSVDTNLFTPETQKTRLEGNAQLWLLLQTIFIIYCINTTKYCTKPGILRYRCNNFFTVCLKFVVVLHNDPVAQQTYNSYSYV